MPLTFPRLSAVALAAMFGISTVTPKGSAHSRKAEVGDTPLDEDLSKLPFSKERTLTRSAVYQYDLSSLVGHALFLTKSGNTCNVAPESVDAIYVSPLAYTVAGTKVSPTTVNKVIYDHKVGKGSAATLSIFGFSAGLNDDKLAQVTITDAAFANLPPGSLAVDFAKKIATDAAFTGCPALLITGVKVRVASYKYFRTKNENAGGFLQSIFGANGKIYSEEAMTDNEVAIAFDASIISPSSPGQAPVAKPLALTDASVAQSLNLKNKAFMALDAKAKERLMLKMK